MFAILMSFVLFTDGGPVVLSPSQDAVMTTVECQKFVDNFSKKTPEERAANTASENGRLAIDKQYRCVVIPSWDSVLEDMVSN